jgi:hypothetical protein
MSIARFALLLLASSFAVAQESSVSVGSPQWGGLIVRFAAKVEPAANGPDRLLGGVMPFPGGTHRVVSDAAHKRQFGYDLSAMLLPDGKTLQLTLAPLQRGPNSFEVQPGWTLDTLQKLPAIPALRSGDTAAFDLLVNPGTGQKVVEYLSVEHADLDPARIAKTPPRDFAIDDVELLLDRPRVWINGKFVEATADSSGGIRAHAVWLYLPGEGTFAITLFPEAGFHKAGMLQGQTITFRNGASEYRVECAAPIAPGSGIFNLYMHYEPGAGNRRLTEFSIGGADKSAWLVRKN